MKRFIIYGFVLIALFNAAEALNCYYCNSNENVGCEWGLVSFTYNVETCASAGVLDKLIGPKCYKITARNQQGDSYVARGCQNPPAIGCSAVAKTLGWISDLSSNDPGGVSDINCVTCESDKCNSAAKMTGFSLVGFFLTTFVLMFKLFMF